MRECPSCRTANEDGAGRCDQCGYQFASDPGANPPSSGVMAQIRKGIVKGVVGGSLLAAAFLAAVIIYGRSDAPQPSPYPTAPIERAKEVLPGGEDTVVRDQLRTHLRENFGKPGYATSWYPAIKEVWVIGDRVVANTTALPGSYDARSICGALSGFVYDRTMSHGLRQVEVRGDGNVLLVHRSGASDRCQ